VPSDGLPVDDSQEVEHKNTPKQAVVYIKTGPLRTYSLSGHMSASTGCGHVVSKAMCEKVESRMGAVAWAMRQLQTKTVFATMAWQKCAKLQAGF
jgi:hypothetical protein